MKTLFCSLLIASTYVSHALAADLPPNVYSADQIESKLLTDKSRKIPAFKQAYDTVQKKNYLASLKALKKLESLDEFGDYFHYLSGLNEHYRMQSLIQSKRLANATIAFEQVLLHLVQVQGSNAYTSLQRRAGHLLGTSEVTIAEVFQKLGRRQRAMTAFENGFQRLTQVNALSFTPKKAIVSYALLCEKNSTELCLSWVEKLAPIVARSDENKIVQRLLPPKKTPAVEKTTQTQYRVDLDLQAFQKAFTFYLDGKYEEAADTWYELLREYPRTTIKLRTKFWLARAAQKLKKDAQAETLYRQIIKELPFSYYALLSSWMGGIDLGRILDAEVPLATTTTPALTPTEVTRIRRAEILIASGVPELAQIELQDIRPTGSMSNEFVVYLAVLNSLATNHLAAFSVFGELSSRGYGGMFSSFGEKIFFPTPFSKTIESNAKDFAVDPSIVFSIIKQESGFNSQAASSANAFGLMQIIPPTARDLDPTIDGDALFQPQHNIKLGTKYISQLLKRYRGNLINALAAYNAGPGNSDRWAREAPPSLPPEEYIELIGFRETREYVQNISRNIYWYNRRLKGEIAPNLSAVTNVVLTR